MSSLLPSSNRFYNPGLAFRREEEDEDDDSNDSRERDEGERMMTRTTTTVAMGGAMSKDNETGTLSRAVATERLVGSPPLHNKRKAGISRNLLSERKFLFIVNIIQ